MKLFNLLEATETSKYSMYLQRLVEKTKSFVPPISEMRDALGDADIYHMGANYFMVVLPVTGTFRMMDISDLYDGNREMKRKLRLKTAKARAESPEFEQFKRQAFKMVRVWQFYGLKEITRTEGPGVEIYKSSVEDFDPEKAFKLNNKFEMYGSLKLLFRDDGSLDKE